MIYLFGHKGFVGTGIGLRLQDHGIEYIGIDRENYDLYKGSRCDLFINAAGNSKKFLAAQDPQLDFQMNVADVMRSLSDFQYGTYIYLSTIDVYDDHEHPENNAEDTTIDPVHLSNYGFHKRLAELLVMRHAQHWLILRLGGMVGPGLKKNAIYDLQHGGKLYINPKSAYQYISTLDVGEAILRLKDSDKEMFNVCGDGTITPEQIADWLGKELPADSSTLPRETYLVNIGKLKEAMRVKTSEETVRAFLHVP